MDNCATCGQAEDMHFMDFVRGVPHVGSYNKHGNAQQCSPQPCTCNTLHDRSCFYYQVPTVKCGVSTEGASWAMETQCGCRGLRGHAPGCALYRGAE